VRPFCNGNIQACRLYVRVSTSDRGQTVENQLQPLQEAAGRLGWTVISGTKGRDKRPGLDVELAPGGSPTSGWDWIASG
jgi:Resolvase, N terminal domain